MNTSPASQPDDTGTQPELCETCQHPVSLHDAISSRWCAASGLAVGRRECICAGVATKARSLSHY